MSNSKGVEGTGSGNQGGLKETPVDDPFLVHRGIPRYTFASLPHVDEKLILLGPNVFGVDHVYRMTSPYDPVVQVFNTDINASTGVTNVWNAVTADSSDSTIIKANWFDYYASIYNYYHVISCRWNVYIENKSMQDLVVHQMFYNDELPPAGATNTDMMNWPGVRTAYLKAPGNAIISNGRLEYLGANQDTDPNIKSEENDQSSVGQFNYETGNHMTSRSGHVSTNFSGIYAPGDYDHEIRLDVQVENWTLVTTNPLLTERLLIRVKPESNALQNDGGNYGHQLSYKLIAKLEYLVEFKEVKSGLRWPVQRQPAVVSISSDITTSTN